MSPDRRDASTAPSGTTPPRVLHISPTDIEGGAAMGAYGMHQALQRAGVESLMLVQRKYSDDPSVITRGLGTRIVMEALRDRIDRIPLRFQRRQPDNWWTVGVLPIDVSRAVRRLRPDIVQFHWAGRGAAPIETLRGVGDLPILWTLRDMWPLTGGCHYSGGCRRFLAGCGNCPQIGSVDANDLSAWQWRRKQLAWRGVDLTFVALSRWMAENARQSPLVRGRPVEVIPNGVDTRTFAPMDRAEARRRWDLPADRKIVMFGALFGTQDPRKGFPYFCGALQRLLATGRGRDMLAVVFGAEGGARDLSIEARFVGTIRDRAELAALYACADVMVVPSLEENFGKTTLEAMACGIPTVAFANTGQLDIIDHKVDGYLAEDRSPEDLANGILWCLDPEGGAARLSRNARAKVEEKFDIGLVATRYVALYTRLIDARKVVSKDSRSGQFDGAAAAAPGQLVARITPGHGGGRA